MVKTLTLFSHRQGPNPWKTVTILEELGLPYETIFYEFGSSENGVEGEDFLKKNPAGRVPLIYDPNHHGIGISESNTIAQYLIDKYDTEKRLTITTEPEKYVLNQWLLFQGATQGPFFAQSLVFAAKQNPEGRQHFQDLVKRTLGTLNTALAGKTYLVGEKCTIADLAFVNWDLMLDAALRGDKEAATKEQRQKMFPNWAAWHERLVARPAVRRMMESQREANA